MKKFIVVLAVFILHNLTASSQEILKASSFKHYIDKFNAKDTEHAPGFIPNTEAWDFLSANIPLLDVPDEDIQRTYYFRWWTYRKHIKKTPEGYVITEFLPDVPWAGKYNTISCPASLHFYEGRWLRNRDYLNDYATFWFKRGGNPRLYSFWAADAIYNFYLVSHDKTSISQLFPELQANYMAWEKDHLDANGLFWQTDDRDGMEVSVCGSGYRPTINSYLFGDALAISKMATLLGKPAIATAYAQKAATLKQLMQTTLWDALAGFFKVKPRAPAAGLCDAKELLGYTPWYFNLPDETYSKAWRYLNDTAYFKAPFGPTSAERNHPGFKISYQGHECQWNGPSWPYATSITLTAMANLLNNYQQDIIKKANYYELLKTYSVSQQLKTDMGHAVPWIDENLNPFTGDWISRTRLKTWENGTWSTGKGGVERGKDYNHSTYCDLVISGLIGLRPDKGDRLVINPLVPDEKWDYFCLDNVLYHGKNITILYDRSGKRYKKGRGLIVFVNGQKKAASKVIKKLVVKIT